ncbi:sacsin N-terminal ATP-binding-like domain-containing protein [Amycolatopsis albispora]|uniref:Molecular chaperone Hsp90 n=1 Tax=Amycolatopsis albispora TaxID=1804986 RepID=A0A344LBR2_9PSEU|nr:molecular chaperone Hsp90 [Amycolatopsis albispora]AXB45486.1 molecular chaperone Hsp90 [Amycolatopsis albispora]
MTLPSDPFGTESIRTPVLTAWRDSPTRFTEDTNTERDLRVGGYRDRLFVELAQNAADAAKLGGGPGTLRVSIVDGELRVANTGAPLDAAGVASLASLRASAKGEGLVGRFGVGFAAVLAVTDEPRVVSTSGGVRFSAARTREESGREGEVPVLRLPWPTEAGEPPLPSGFDTEVRLPLRSTVDGKALLAELDSAAEDLLLALPWLNRVDIDGRVWLRSEVAGALVITAPDGKTRRWLTHGSLDIDCVWAVQVLASGEPIRLESSVLHAPTPTDERLSLPARLIATIPIEPSRRRVLPGPGVRSALEAAAAAYPGLVRKLHPEYRPALVPAATFPLSEVDTTLRELITERLRADAWLPAADGDDLTGGRGRVLTAESPKLVELLAEAIPGLIALSGPRVQRDLAPVGVEPITIAQVIEQITGLSRDPSWWRDLYDQLLPLLEAHSVSADELGGLPVPLVDGRTLPGPRGSLLFGAADDLLELLAEAGIGGLRLVHPDAAHPLLERLGAKQAEARDLLESPALREAVERGAEGSDVVPLAGAVLRLAYEAPVDWLGSLVLPTERGWRRADELVLPTSPLLRIFDPEAIGEDAPLDVLDTDFAEDWPADVLAGAGVLDTFVLQEDEDEPEVRDLDLVADDRWPDALRLLAARPETWRVLSDPDSRTARWLAVHAELAGRPPADWRMPDATTLAGLYDPVPDVGLPDEVLIAAGVRTSLAVSDADDVADLMDRLADDSREVSPGLAARAHTVLADAEFTEDYVPSRVRALDGSVCDAEDAVVLDTPWPLGVLPASRVVAALPGAERAARLAELLDLPLAGERVAEVRVDSEGELIPWRELAAVVVVADLLGLELPDGGVHIHEELTVAFGGTSVAVPWWYDGALHAADTSEGLARALAWAMDRWNDRHTITAFLDEPTAESLHA